MKKTNQIIVQQIELINQFNLLLSEGTLLCFLNSPFAILSIVSS